MISWFLNLFKTKGIGAGDIEAYRRNIENRELKEAERSFKESKNGIIRSIASGNDFIIQLIQMDHLSDEFREKLKEKYRQLGVVVDISDNKSKFSDAYVVKIIGLASYKDNSDYIRN